MSWRVAPGRSASFVQAVGSGREMWVFGLEEYLEVKAKIGFTEPTFA